MDAKLIHFNVDLGPPQLSSKFGKKDRGRGPDVRPRYDDRYDRFDPRDAGYRDYPRDDRYRAPPAYDRLPYPDRGLPPYRDDR